MDTDHEGDSEYDLDEEDNFLDDEVEWQASLANEMPAPEDKEIDDEMDYDPG